MSFVRMTHSVQLTSGMEHGSKVHGGWKGLAVKDAVFDTESPGPQPFVRNSVARRNRRSRRSTTSSKSSEQSLGIGTSTSSDDKGPIVESVSERISETECVFEEPLDIRNLYDQPRNFGRLSPPKEENSTDISPGISPYRSPSLHQKENRERKKSTSVSEVQGATCQYKTITTSFRGPTWRPLSSSNPEPLAHNRHQHSTNNNNNIRDFTRAEWQSTNSSNAKESHSSIGTHNNHQKPSAKVALKALGKKLFSTKGKSPSASGHHIADDYSSDSVKSEKSFASSYYRQNFHNSNHKETPKSRRTLQPSPFEQRKQIFERGSPEIRPKVSYSWRQPRKPQMADVASLPHAGAREQDNFASKSSQRDVSDDDKDDAAESSIEELEGLLKQYTDRDKRVKIRETIRLLKQSLQEGDTGSTGHQATNTSHKSTFASPGSSSHSPVATPETPVSSSLSRFNARSTSLRNPRPSYQPPAQAVNRANSFKLSRPKDFILQKVGSSPQLTKVPESTPEDFKEYADNLNNNIPPKYTKVPGVNSTPNKTASPFNFKKQAWTPPSLINKHVTPFSAAVNSAPPALRRSESTKENRTVGANPIAVVHGNLRRSKSILGRILGQKIDAEKTPFVPSFIAPAVQRNKDTVRQEVTASSEITKAPSPKPAPRHRRLVETQSAPVSTREADSSPLKQTTKVTPSPEAKPRSCSSRSSTSSSSVDGDHVYQVAGSESDISSSEESEADSRTLSELIQATRDNNDNKTASNPPTDPDTTSSGQKSVNCDQSEELESENLLDDQSGDSITKEFTNKKKEQVVEEKAPKSRVLQPLKSHTVCETEEVQLFQVHIIRPVGVKPSQQQAPQATREREENKETKTDNKKETERKESSSSTSTLSSSESEEDILSDDEGSDSDETMDRYSSRALQNRTSVKSQVSAKEDDINANSTTKTASSRRLRDRHNKPLNTGDDVRTRMQRFKGQTNGDATSDKVVKRNGSVKTTVPGGKKVDVSKFENGNENVKVTSTTKKTTITLSTTAPKSSRSISREEKPSNKENKVTSATKPYQNGSSTPSEDNASRKSSTSSSATDDSTRARRNRRAKVPSTGSEGLDRLEKASRTATSELKELHSSSYNSEVVVSTRLSKEREKEIAKDDPNNNDTTKSEDIAPTSEASVEDSLSNWSARRRKRRKQRATDSSATASGTDNEKSTEENAKDKEAEEASEAKATLRHVTHSAPALADMGDSLSGYTVKLKFDGHSKIHEEEITVTEEKANEPTDSDLSKGTRVRGRYSRSRSSTSSASSEIEKASSTRDNDSNVSATEDDSPAQVIMEVGSADDDIVADDTGDQSKECVDDVEEREEENERTDEIRESEKQEEIEESNEKEAETESDTVENTHLAEKDKDITENKSHFEDELSVEQTNDDDTHAEDIYKEEIVDVEPNTEATPKTEEAQDTQVTEIEEAKEDTLNADTVASSEQEIEKPKRRHQRKRDEESEDNKSEQVKEPKPRQRRHKDKKEEVKEEVKTEQESPEKTEVEENNQVEDKKEEPITQEVEPEPEEKQQQPKEEAKIDEKPKTEEAPKTMLLSYDNVEEISDIKLLEKMLDGAKEFEQRRRIRGVIRALKRGEKPKAYKDPKANGAVSAIEALRARKTEPKDADTAKNGSLPQESAKETRYTSSKTTVTRTEKSDLGTKYTSVKTERKTTTTMTSKPKKIGSIFDRDDDEDDRRKTTKSSGSSRLADLERRQAERRRELQRNRSMPATSSKDARNAFKAKLESNAPKGPAKKVGRSPTFVVPNANNVKQLLLKWCQSKTRGYEHVDIMNFSSSWASGMAFCALVHNFFPEAFDYNQLDPKNKAENLDLAFKKADELGDIPQLLDTEDMISMAEPDWKCVYTYIGEFYKRIRDLGLN